MGLSRERIRQIESQALEAMRRRISSPPKSPDRRYA
jgi:DNA-directed RNA polymerase sigma subunit (sigma70/sigma32)